jgi:hypothetical protein
MDVTAAKNIIWQRIREHQSLGGAVRSGEMSLNFGGKRGGSVYRLDLPVCLLGLMAKEHESGEGVVETASRILDISKDDTYELEAGFESWGSNERTNPFYQLGQDIARQLTLEESKK